MTGVWVMLETDIMNTDELKQIEEQALEMGVMNDWERGFLSDVIRRGKKLSSKQMSIVNRIKSKVDNYDESSIPAWVKTLQAGMADEEYFKSMPDFTRRFASDMIQRGMSGRSIDSFSPRQREILEAIINGITEFKGNRDEILAQREAERIEQEKRRAEQQAAAAERRRLEQQIITESGFERLHALIAGAKGRLQQPSITVRVTLGDEFNNAEQPLCFQADKHNSNVYVKSNHRKGAIRFGIINEEGLFTFNGTLPASHRAAARIVAEDPLNAIIEFGHASGSCSFCRKDLTDMRSVSVGYGPICAKKFNLPWSSLNITQMTEFMVAKAQSVRSLVDSESTGMKTTQSIKCDDCSLYVLHPDDYVSQAERGNSHLFCNNGMCRPDNSPVFEVESAKCPARFVVETPLEMIEAYKAAFGFDDGVVDVDASDMQAFAEQEASEEASEPANDVDAPEVADEESSEGEAIQEASEPVDDGLFWTTDGKSFKSRQGRYNYCKRTGAGYR